ncbi:Adenylate kinase [Streptomyces sp. TLI_053]|uniref:shikimate kinase n=1 Tax=Streptomyces sp. TLI_053 TaxID=1855352 RepID=UPI000879BA7C|nr:shikimate kinase [Streptomyces sp. TLI_053]SDT83352.1 Adenylate kinase [Streptomyces sp. TLI_053]
MKRVVVVGAAGAGKTTLARRLSAALEVPFTDLDALFWAPGWQRVPADRFRVEVERVAAAPGWLVAGNFFASVVDPVWTAADTVVWLDLPRRVTFARVVRRTVLQAVRREELFPGCRQSLWAAWRDGLFATAWREPACNRVVVPELLAQPGYAHLRLVRLAGRHEVSNWAASVRAQHRDRCSGDTE